MELVSRKQPCLPRNTKIGNGSCQPVCHMPGLLFSSGDSCQWVDNPIPLPSHLVRDVLVTDRRYLPVAVQCWSVDSTSGGWPSLWSHQIGIRSKVQSVLLEYPTINARHKLHSSNAPASHSAPCRSPCVCGSHAVLLFHTKKPRLRGERERE